MTPEEKELHEFFASILSEKAKKKFDQLMEISRGDYSNLQRIWNYCHDQQVRIRNSEKESLPLSEYEQGKIIACREIQYEINKKCSNLDEQT